MKAFPQASATGNIHIGTIAGHTTLNFTDGVRMNLSVLGDDDSSEFVDTVLENPEEAVQDPGSPQGRCRRPIRRSLCCRSDGIRDIGSVRDRQ